MRRALEPMQHADHRHRRLLRPRRERHAAAAPPSRLMKSRRPMRDVI
jgi:hypothetical protein